MNQEIIDAFGQNKEINWPSRDKGWGSPCNDINNDNNIHKK